MFNLRRREFLTLLGSTVAAALPLSARAQEPMPVIGYVNSRSAQGDAPFRAAFQQGLRETGYIEGRNVSIEYYWAEGHYDRMPGMVTELVRRQVAVIAANTPAAPVAKAATTTIPIVFLSADDPVENGLVKSLNRPGGNATGVSLISGALGGNDGGAALRPLLEGKAEVPPGEAAVRAYSFELIHLRPPHAALGTKQRGESGLRTHDGVSLPFKTTHHPSTCRAASETVVRLACRGGVATSVLQGYQRPLRVGRD